MLAKKRLEHQKQEDIMSEMGLGERKEYETNDVVAATAEPESE